MIKIGQRVKILALPKDSNWNTYDYKKHLIGKIGKITRYSGYLPGGFLCCNIELKDKEEFWDVLDNEISFHGVKVKYLKDEKK